MGKRPKYIDVDGFRLPPTFEPEIFRSAAKYKPGKGDVIVSTYPKCGTTWAQQITLLILRKGQPPLTTQEYFSSLPFLEITEIEKISEMPEPRCIKMHLPFDRITFSEEAKYIYVARHPADCVVSFYHHTKFFPIYFFSDGTFDDYFDAFIEGQVDFNDYFDNLLSWYEHRNKPNVFFITFENMKTDHRGAVLKIARFLGDDYYQCLIDNDEEVLKNVLHYSSFDYMKSTINNFWNEGFVNSPSEESQKESAVAKKFATVLHDAKQNGHVSTGEFIRKGTVGDGKIVLSEEQMNRLKARIMEKTSHSDVMNLWEKK